MRLDRYWCGYGSNLCLIFNTPPPPRTQADNRRLEEEEGRAAREEEKGALQGPVMMAGRAPAPAAEKGDKEMDA